MDTIKKFTTELEENPTVQIKFHKRMMRIWAVNAPIILGIYVVTFFVSEKQAIQILAFITFYTSMVSLYANWVSDFDGLSAAQSTLETMKQSTYIEPEERNYNVDELIEFAKANQYTDNLLEDEPLA